MGIGYDDNSSIPPPPLVPLQQIGFMVFSWISLIIYFLIIFVISSQKKYYHVFGSSFFTIVKFQFFADFLFFFLIEFYNRPRKYRYWGLYTQDIPEWLSYCLWIAVNVVTNAVIIGHVLFALNRLTAFTSPYYHAKLWSTRRIFFYVLLIWIVSYLLIHPMLYYLDVHITRNLADDGSAYYITENMKIEDRVVMLSVCLFVVVISGLCYGKAFYTSMYKDDTAGSNARSREVEVKILVCSAITFIPVCVEMMRSAGTVYARATDDLVTLKVMQEYWSMVMESMSFVTCWTLLLTNPHIRRCIVDTIFRRRGCEKSNSTGSLFVAARPANRKHNHPTAQSATLA